MLGTNSNARNGRVFANGVIAMAAIAAMALFAAGSSALAQSIETEAPYVIVIDSETNTVLLEKEADKPVPPASLSKLMTVEVILHALEEGELSLDDTFPVSENAWRKGGAPSGGSTMFAELNSQIAVRDLLQGIIVQSGNDACIIVAEGMAGSEEAFATLMNERATAIGLSGSTFRNATGLYEPGHLVTMRDLAKLARHLIRTYPEYYRYYSQPEFTWNGILQRNRNPLLGSSPGADGLKTGYVQESGYGLVASAERDGRRVILAMTGLESPDARAEEGRKLIDWSYRAFEQLTLFEKGERVGEARVHGGTERYVPLVGNRDISILVPRTGERRLSARIYYQGPLIPPVEANTQVGELRVESADGVRLEAPLYTEKAVPRGELHQRALDGVLDLATRWW